MSFAPNTPITKAIFPVAGLGTRFLPATKAQPKEMPPVVDKPLIPCALEDAYVALALRHAQTGPGFRAYLKGLNLAQNLG